MRPLVSNQFTDSSPSQADRGLPPPLLGRPELKLALFFVLVASTWVAWSDLIFVHILRIPVESMLIYTFKGMNVAATTGVLFYVILRRAYDGWRRSEMERLAELTAASESFRSLSSRIQMLREEERTSISREVHDELGQLLTGLKLKVRRVENHLDQSNDRSLNPHIEDLVEAGNIIDETITAVRRIATGLRPATLDHLGLACALQEEADDFSRRAGIACKPDLTRLTDPVPADVATAAFRVCQESLTNVARHAGATRVMIECETRNGELILRVRDDGIGCDPVILADSPALGLLGMRERAHQLNGNLELATSSAEGTSVTLRLPLTPPYSMKILLVDDHAVVRHGLAALLRDALPAAEFGEASDAAAGLVTLLESTWDLAIVDIALPGRNGLDLLADIRAAKLSVPVLVVSAHAEEDYAIRSLKLGAVGYVCKQSAPDTLVTAVGRALAGGRHISQSLAERLAGNLSGDVPEASHEALSNRELQVLKLIAGGKTLKEIGAILSLSEKTIATYRARITEKMGLSSNVELTRYAMRQGLVD